MMLHISDLLNKANTTYNYPSNFCITEGDDNRYHLTFTLGVNAKLVMTIDAHFEVESIDDGSREFYISLLREFVQVFNQMDNRDKVLKQFQRWQHVYMNQIRDEFDIVDGIVSNNGEVQFGSKQARYEELKGILEGIGGVMRSSDSCQASTLSVSLDMTNRIQISTGYDKTTLDDRDGVYTRDKGVIEIPYELNNQVDYYNALLTTLHTCLNSLDGDYKVYSLYTQWERSFIKELYDTNGFKIKPQSRISK